MSAAHVLHHAPAAAVGVAAEHAAGGDEHAGVVVRRRGHVVSGSLGVVAARHAVVIHRAQVVRNPHLWIEAQAAFVDQAPGFPDEFVALPQHQRQPGLLAHFHRVAAQRAPSLIERLRRQGLTGLATMRGLAALRVLERGLDALPVGVRNAGQNDRSQVSVEARQKVESLGLVVVRVRKHRVATHGAVVRQPVVVSFWHRRLLTRHSPVGTLHKATLAEAAIRCRFKQPRSCQPVCCSCS